MGKILAFTVRALGHIYPLVPVLQELDRRGHEVLCAICGTGTDERLIGGIPVRNVAWNPDDLRGEAVGNSMLLRRYQSQGAPIAARLCALIAEERPDFLLVDAMLWGGFIAAEASQLPWASLSLSPDTIRGTGLDVRGPGLPPPRNPLTRLLHRKIDKQLRAANRPFLVAMNAVRTAYRLQPLVFTPDIYHTPPLTLAATAEPFEYPRSDWNPGMRFVGPLLWEPEPDVTDAELRRDESLILVATSSVEDEIGGFEWCRLVVDAFERAPLRVVMTHRTTMPMPSLPRNIEILQHARHTPLIREARCVICHGGAGVVHKALAEGVPVVAIPTGHDRFEVAQRLEHARAGVRLDPQRATPVALRRAVLKAQKRRPGALRIAAAFAASGGASQAADEVERLLCGA